MQCRFFPPSTTGQRGESRTCFSHSDWTAVLGAYRHAGYCCCCRPRRLQSRLREFGGSSARCISWILQSSSSLETFHEGLGPGKVRRTHWAEGGVRLLDCRGAYLLVGGLSPASLWHASLLEVLGLIETNSPALFISLRSCLPPPCRRRFFRQRRKTPALELTWKGATGHVLFGLTLGLWPGLSGSRSPRWVLPWCDPGLKRCSRSGPHARAWPIRTGPIRCTAAGWLQMASQS
eukprot:scaffold1227_cov256-Pinguiococcus_pyrenoidosus.AAC.7